MAADAGGFWVFRRLGYTDEENPDRLIIVMQGCMPVGTPIQTAALLPTPSELFEGLRA